MPRKAGITSLVAVVALIAFGARAAAQDDLGFDPERLLLITGEFSPGTPIAERNDAWREARAVAAAVPGITTAVPVVTFPFGTRMAMGLAVADRDDNPWAGRQLPYLNPADPGYLDVLGVRLVEGRGILPADEAPEAEPVAVIEAGMAEFLWPGESPLGRCVHILLSAPQPSAGPARMRSPAPGSAPAGEADDVVCHRIVGVVTDSAPDARGSRPDLMQYYVPFSKVPLPTGFDEMPFHGLLARADGEPSGAVEALAAALDRSARFAGVRVTPFEELITR